MAEHIHADAPKLTRNQSLVMDALAQSQVPLSAYTILDQLRGEGLRAPLQIYRALEKLVDYGLVHRLESLNAFVACNHPHCDGRHTIAFTICDECSQVTEVTDQSVTERMDQIASKAGFKPTKATVELHGVCPDCQR